MLQPKDRHVRTYALGMLTRVNDQPHINKEKLFSDAMAFYRWQCSEKLAEESLGIYRHEFCAHHRQLTDKLEHAVWQACFITWFVEQGFHKLPPLTGFDPHDELMQRTRFSSPSFRLPTGEPADTYLMQWMLWNLDKPPVSPAQAESELLYRWSRGLVDSLPDDDDAYGEALLKYALRFFHWARGSLRTWARFMEYFMAFLYSQPDQIEALLSHPCADALFVLWFARHNLDRSDKGPRGNFIPPTNQM